MKVFCNGFELVWQYALYEKQRGVDAETIQEHIDQMAERYSMDLYVGIASKLSDGQDHIVKLVKNYWTEEDIYNRIGVDTGRAHRPYNFDFQPSDAEWLKSLNPYDIYFMIDEENQLREARNLLFPEDSFSVTVLKHNYRDSEVTEETYHRNCATCLYYEGPRKCPGSAPCSHWGKRVMFNDYCSRWAEDIIDRPEKGQEER